MSQPRRPDEIILFKQLRRTASGCPGFSHAGLSSTRRIIRELGMPERRARYLLLKWTEKAWWDYGLCPEGGWFTSAAPLELTP